MARIEADSMHWLQIDIAGYQFPAGERDEDDANWLVIQLAVAYGDKHWRAREAALLTWEVKHLVRWLQQAALGDELEDFEAIEPNLSVSVAHDGDRVLLVPRFRLEFCRPGLGFDRRVEGESLEYRVSADDIKRFADALATEAARFPERGALS